MIELLLISLFFIIPLYIIFEYFKEKMIEKDKIQFHKRLKVDR